MTDYPALSRSWAWNGSRIRKPYTGDLCPYFSSVLVVCFSLELWFQRQPRLISLCNGSERGISALSLYVPTASPCQQQVMQLLVLGCMYSQLCRQVNSWQRFKVCLWHSHHLIQAVIVSLSCSCKVLSAQHLEGWGI